MDIREICKGEIKIKQYNGWKVIEESEEKIVLEMNRKANTMAFQFEPEFEKMIKEIKEIKLEKCYLRKKNFSTFGKDIYSTILLHKNKKWRIEVEIWDDHEVFEFFSTEDYQLNKENYSTLEELEKRMLKEIQLKTREFIQKDKKRRLRAIFRPFSFDDDYEWLMNA